MSADGTKVIVGAYMEDTVGTDAGAAYIFALSGGSWSQEAKIQSSDIGVGDMFGNAVSMSADGTKVIVGAQREGTGGNYAGAAYSFTLSGGSWSQQQKIVSSDLAAGDNFGNAVSMSADGAKIIVGAYTKAGGGAAYIFVPSGGLWSQQQKILSSDLATGDYLGNSVSMSGDGTKVIVNGGNASYIYTYNGSSWGSEAKIVGSDVQAAHRFGQRHINSDGTKVIVGSMGDDSGGTNSGAAYIFALSGGSWSQEAKIVASDPEVDDRFSIAVSMSSDGTRVILAASYEDTGGTDAGSAYIFALSDGSWSQEAKIQSSEIQAGDFFGYSVSMSSDGTRVIVGAYYEDTGGSNAGAAYSFDYNPNTIYDSSTQVFTATGTGIVSGSTVQLEGADGSLYSLVDATAPNAAGSQVTFKMGAGEVSEFPPSAMSTNTSITGYTASGSGNYNQHAWKAFDDVVNTGQYWPAGNGTLAGGYSTSSPYLAVSSTATTSGHVGHWLQLQIPSAVILTRAVIGTTSSGYQHGQFVILGSNDGTNWTLLHAGTGTTLSTDVTTLSAGLREAFSYFRVVIKSKTSSTQNNNIELNNVQFFGPPSGSWVVSNQPYKVKVSSTSGLIGTSTAAIGFAVGWTSPAAGATLNFNIAATTIHTLVGTDGGGGTNRKFTVVSTGVNALPSNLNITESGVISGLIAADQLNITTPVTIRLTDNGSGLFTDRAINIVGVTDLYTFSPNPFTFTNAGSTGINGPTLTDLTTGSDAYTPTWTDSTNNLNVTAGIQEWTVPVSGTYRIEAFGAGAHYSSGARMRGDFTLTHGEIIHILVGQKHVVPSNPNKQYYSANGGAGGTFVVRSPYDSTGSILVIAGGGGGTPDTTIDAGRDGTTSNNGQDAETTTSGTTGLGGTSGNGGTNDSQDFAPGGGAGFSGDGEGIHSGSGNVTAGSAALSFTNGGTGGAAFGGSYSRGDGGFGGGGAASYGGGAGGGGYSGGGGVASPGNGADTVMNGGGGGSYNSGTNQSNSTGANTGHGYVIVTQL
tara:strand:- start:112 stop:3186 length:3075 start_codon:yes stop_codon:yes gene_type:complete